MNDQLKARLELCKSHVSTSLPYTMRGLISKENGKEIIYTLHTQEHSQKVEQKLQRIIELCNNSPNKKCHITEISEFILYCSAWLHDIGCIVSRKNHGKESETIIHENKDILQGIDGYENLIGMICRSHTYDRKKEEDPVTKLSKKIIAENGDFIFPRYLASIFRLADACDLDRRKAPVLVYRLLSHNMSEKSKRYWKAHNNVYSCGFDKDGILITYFQKSDNDNFIFNELKEQFEEVKEILFEYDFPIKRIVYDYIEYEQNWRNYLDEE